ncbi:unnamed protein product [Clonostachys byssicola]|uniref:Uncharacterized protein n=1 Tax=Clonostachys byssicola TaxID=160290 RepID=A0A9N9XYQ8_9HYPO|nr:unnamed protein product [Clonostachys byssicola]
MANYRVSRVYFKDDTYGIFIMKELSDVSGDFIRHVTQNGTSQVIIEEGIKLKEAYSDWHQVPFGYVSESKAQEVLNMARADRTYSQKNFRDWTDVFIQKMKDEGCL